jgi:uncharacterized protein (TIGR03437 family)
MFGGSDMIAPGTWIELYGMNLSKSTRAWQQSDFNGDTAPTSLDDVRVTVNGRPAFVSYVSPGQVNALVPSTVTPGPAVVTVTSGGQTSAPYRTTINPVQPGLLTLATDLDYAAALFPDFTTYALPPHAAKPGDTLIFFGIGFGSVTPDVPAGQIASGLHTLQGDVQVTFDETPAKIACAGLAPGTIGLYQFNVVVPTLPAGSGIVSVRFSQNGVSLPWLSIAAGQ